MSVSRRAESTIVRNRMLSSSTHTALASSILNSFRNRASVSSWAEVMRLSGWYDIVVLSYWFKWCCSAAYGRQSIMSMCYHTLVRCWMLCCGIVDFTGLRTLWRHLQESFHTENANLDSKGHPEQLAEGGLFCIFFANSKLSPENISPEFEFFPQKPE